MEQPEAAVPAHQAVSVVAQHLVDALDTLHTVEHHLGPYGPTPHPMAHAHVTVAIHAALAAQAALDGRQGGGGR